MKISGPILEGKFLKRLNRFEAIVLINDSEVLTHVPNTGRLRELLLEGADVLVRSYENPSRKTKYGLLLVKKEGIWVSIDSANIPNRVVQEALQDGLLEQFESFSDIRRELTVGDSRFDFGLFNAETEYYIEVKGVTLVDQHIARFPDAPTLRGQKHLDELIRLKDHGKGAGVLFIIQREDAVRFAPNDHTDPVFSAKLRRAYAAGVDLWAYKCMVNPEEIEIMGQVPIIL